MAVRDFVDAAGIAWRVWCTRPTSQIALKVEFAQGWLTFESVDVLRRLAPVPERWEDLADRQLEQLCRAAVVVPRRNRMNWPPPPGSPGRPAQR